MPESQTKKNQYPANKELVKKYVSSMRYVCLQIHGVLVLIGLAIKKYCIMGGHVHHGEQTVGLRKRGILQTAVINLNAVFKEDLLIQ